MHLLLLILLLAGFSGFAHALAIPNYSQAYLVFVIIVPSFFVLRALTSVPRSQQFSYWICYLVVSLAITMICTFYWMLEISILTLFICFIFQAVFLILCVGWSILFRRDQWRYLSYVVGLVIYQIISSESVFTTSFLNFSPWLAVYPSFVQSYRYIGFTGAEIWIILVNFLLYLSIIKQPSSKRAVYIILTVITLLLPITLSILLYTNKAAAMGTKVLLGNTKIAMYKEPYASDANALPYYLSKHTETSKEKIDLAIFPESISNHLGWNGNEKATEQITLMDSFRKAFGIRQMIYGGIQYKQVTEDVKDPYTQFKDGYYYSTHNVALSLTDKGTHVQGKQRFVPFQEYIPYRSVFEKVTKRINQVGYQGYVAPLNSSVELDNDFLTLICYEAVQPTFVAQKSKGKKFIVVLSNESWTQSEQYNKQYSIYLSAIAARANKPLIKSSNNGPSLHLNAEGKCLSSFSDGYSRIIKL